MIKSDSHLDRFKYFLFLIISSLFSYMFVLFFFAPRFILWRQLGQPITGNVVPPEIFRAIFVLKQLENPFIHIDNPGNHVINWRLFFPLLGHYLHIPKSIFFILPHLGVLLTLGTIIHVVNKEGQGRIFSICVAILLATTSWFFTSTGYLLNFDAWVLLGMLVVAFFSSDLLLFFACLCVPWIDERFILALPLCLLVRASYFQWEEEGVLKKVCRDGFVLLIAVLPYVCARVAALMTGADTTSLGYLNSRLVETGISMVLAIEGMFAGLRFVWMLIVIFIVYNFIRKKFFWGGTVLLVSVITAFFQPFIAQDLSRSMFVFVPCGLMAVILMIRQRMVYRTHLVIAIFILNLVNPAVHIMHAHGMNYKFKINNFIYEMRSLR